MSSKSFSIASLASSLLRSLSRLTSPALDSAPRAGNDYSQAAAALNSLASISAAVVTRLRALPEPAGNQTLLSRIWDAADSEDTDVQNAAQAIAGGNVQVRAAAVATLNVAGSFYSGLAQGYGFKVC
jgi:hypothetical protein